MLGLVLVTVYRQFADQKYTPGEERTVVQKKPLPLDKKSPGKEMVVVPSSVDDITVEITAETSLDEEALFDEERTELEDIESDSQSVVQFGTTYDEKNY